MIAHSSPPRVGAAGAKLAIATVGGLAALFAILPVWSTAYVSSSLNFTLKYFFSACVWLSVLMLAARYQKIVLFPTFLLAPLVLSIAGLISFSIIQLTDYGRTSYGAALVPLVVCAIPMFVPTDCLAVNYVSWIRSYKRLLLLGSCSHIAWQGFALLVIHDTSAIMHSHSFLLVFLMAISGFCNDRILFVIALLFIALSTVLRPSSTLAVSAGIGLLTVALYRYRCFWLYRWTAYGFLCLVIAVNAAVLVSHPTAEWVFGLEPGLKKDIGGETTVNFRVGVVDALGSEMKQHSLLVGKMFSGDITPNVAYYLPRFESDHAAIHSDFQVLLSQGGLVGYALFAATFLGLLHFCYCSGALARAHRDDDLAAFFDVVPALTLVFSVYISFNPVMTNIADALFFLMLFPLSVLPSRQLFLLDLSSRASAHTRIPAV